ADDAARARDEDLHIRKRRSCGAVQTATATLANVMHPPKTTDGASPISLAARPDSNAPIWFEERIKMPLTEATRPRKWSGVSAWYMLERMTMLMPSTTPLARRISKESQKRCENAKAIMHSPKAAKDAKEAAPIFWNG